MEDSYSSKTLDHSSLVAGMFDELGLGEVIDPALLVRAATAGIDLCSALNDLYAPLPNYRFQFMLQKALELCNELKVWGLHYYRPWKRKTQNS